MKKKNILLCMAIALCGVPCMADRPLTVEQLFALIDKGNSTLRTQKTGIEAATQGIDVAKAQRLPDINTQLSLSYNGNVLMTDRDFSNATTFTQPHFGNSFALEAQQVVYAGGAVNAGIKIAELQKTMAENSIATTRNALCFAALGEYLDLQKLDNGIKVYDENIALTRRLVEDIQAKQQQGIALKNDITRYELQLQDLELGKRKLEDSRAILNHQLCVTIGIADEKIITDSTIADAMFGKDGEEFWQKKSLITSPEMTRSALSTQMAEQQLKIAKSDLLPKVAIVAADHFSGPYQYDIPPINNNFNVWFVGVAVKYSLSSLYKGNRKVKQAETTLRQAQESNTVVTDNLNTRMQEAYTLYMQSYTELETQHKSVQLATQNYEVVNDRYLNQLALITDMLDASNIKLSAELKEVNAKINIAFAYYKLKFIAGEI